VLVIIAWLNNFVVLSIAYDRISPLRRPMRWEYIDVLSISLVFSFLSCCEVYAAFLLSSGGYLLFTDYPTPAQIRTCVFLVLSVSDQSTIFSIRSRGPVFTSHAPSAMLVVTVLLCAVASSLMALFWPFGSSLEPIYGFDVLQCWLILLFFFLLKEVAKVLVYYIIDYMFPYTTRVIPKMLQQERLEEL